MVLWATVYLAKSRESFSVSNMFCDLCLPPLPSLMCQVIKNSSVCSFLTCVCVFILLCSRRCEKLLVFCSDYKI